MKKLAIGILVFLLALVPVMAANYTYSEVGLTFRDIESDNVVHSLPISLVFQNSDYDLKIESKKFIDINGVVNYKLSPGFWKVEVLVDNPRTPIPDYHGIVTLDVPKGFEIVEQTVYIEKVGFVDGFVTDEKGSLVKNAEVNLKCGDKFSTETTSDDYGSFDFGIVPVENTLGGVVSQVNQLILNTELFVSGAVELSIHHCLLGLSGADHRELRIVYSHYQALEQCHHFLVRNKLEPAPYYDTAGAAKMLAEKAPKATAVIASNLCAELYNLEIIKENIEDFTRNKTRFLVFAKKENTTPGSKCSIIFSTEHKAGTLFRVLEVFARKNLNLTRIESIPNQLGSFVFFLDFEGSRDDDNVVTALEDVKKITTRFRMMGFYDECRDE